MENSKKLIISTLIIIIGVLLCGIIYFAFSKETNFENTPLSNSSAIATEEIGLSNSLINKQNKEKDYVLGLNSTKNEIEIWEVGDENGRTPLIFLPTQTIISSQKISPNNNRIVFVISTYLDYKFIENESSSGYSKPITSVFEYNKENKILNLIRLDVPIKENINIFPLVNSFSPEGNLVAFDIYPCTECDGEMLGIYINEFKSSDSKTKFIVNNLNFKFLGNNMYQYNEIIECNEYREQGRCIEKGALRTEKF